MLQEFCSARLSLATALGYVIIQMHVFFCFVGRSTHLLYSVGLSSREPLRQAAGVTESHSSFFGETMLPLPSRKDPTLSLSEHTSNHAEGLFLPALPWFLANYMPICTIGVEAQFLLHERPPHRTRAILFRFYHPPPPSWYTRKIAVKRSGDERSKSFRLEGRMLTKLFANTPGVFSSSFDATDVDLIFARVSEKYVNRKRQYNETRDAVSLSSLGFSIIHYMQ